MRMLAAVSLFLLLPLYLASVDGRISFSTVGATSDTYRFFIHELRGNLTAGVSTIYGIPVLNSSTAVPDSQRFILVDLSNARVTITLAIDVVSANLVAYSADSRSYFLKDAPVAAFNSPLFPDTTGHVLFFTTNSFDLERAQQIPRTSNHLGLQYLDVAITRLYSAITDDYCKAGWISDIIQMVNEAAKFRFIEQRVRNSINTPEQQAFHPDRALLSLVDNWTALSLEIQRSLNGVFQSKIRLEQITGHDVFLVDNIRSSVIAGVALLLHQCHSTDITLNMPVSEAAEENANVMCAKRSATTSIMGRDGMCVDVKGGMSLNGNPVQLSGCVSPASPYIFNQYFTFRTDGTIRWKPWNEKYCLTRNTTSSTLMIYECNSADPESIKWIMFANGTISNPDSGLVLTANRSNQGTILTAETDIGAATQGWKAEYAGSSPTVTTIVGFKELCLEAYNGNSVTWLLECVAGKKEQQWALYGDGTIRVSLDRSLCVTSYRQHSIEPIIIRKCDGSVNQRWVFQPDGTILNPNAKLVMDVRDRDVSLQQIILYPRSGKPNQQWLPFF